MAILDKPRSHNDEPRPEISDREPSRALHYLPATAFGLDAAIMVGCVLMTAIITRFWEVFARPAGAEEYALRLAAATVVTWLATIAVYGAYSSDIFIAGTEEYKRLTRATLLAYGLVLVVCFLGGIPLARGPFVVTFLLGLPGLLVGRFMLRRTVHQAHIHGHMLSRVLIAGSGAHIDEIAAVLKRTPWLGYEIVGAVTPTGAEIKTPRGLPVVGAIDEIHWRAVDSRPEVVFFAGGSVESAKDLSRLAWDLSKHDIQLVVAPSVTEVSRDRVRIRPVAGLPLIHVDSPRASTFSRYAKRTFDIVGSLGAIVVFLPVMVGLAAWVRISDRGPALFPQTRVGRKGEGFACLKFRTMVTNAEELLDELKEANGFEGGLVQDGERPADHPSRRDHA